MIRATAYAGQFYSGTPDELRAEALRCIGPSTVKVAAIGAVVPHAAYIYSGTVAAHTIASMEPRTIYIILGAKHSELGAPFSLSDAQSWHTPLGDVPVDRELSRELIGPSTHIRPDHVAHMYEHSIEVQLPFLQLTSKRFTIAPIVIAAADAVTYRAIGEEIASVVKKLKIEKKVAIIASSDMTHYEPHGAAKAKDARAIDAILALDADRLVSTVDNEKISMCGCAPTAVMISAARALGAASARLVEYRTSGETSGDLSSVVGYAGILVTA